MNRGKLVISHPDSTNDIEIESEDMTYKPEKIFRCGLQEARFNLLHLGSKYDKWMQNLFQNDDLKLMYYYTDKPIRPVREKYTDIYPDNFKSTDFVMCNFNSHATVISWASIDDVQSRFD